MILLTERCVTLGFSPQNGVFPPHAAWPQVAWPNDEPGHARRARVRTSDLSGLVALRARPQVVQGIEHTTSGYARSPHGTRTQVVEVAWPGRSRARPFPATRPPIQGRPESDIFCYMYGGKVLHCFGQISCRTAHFSRGLDRHTLAGAWIGTSGIPGSQCQHPDVENPTVNFCAGASFLTSERSEFAERGRGPIV